MNAIKNYCEQFSSIDWNKQARETVLPYAASLSVGAVINYDNPAAYAVSYLFRRCVVSSLNALNTGEAIAKLAHRISPSVVEGSHVFPIGCNVVLSLATTVASCQLSGLVGYPISTGSAMAGAMLGGVAHLAVGKVLAEDPFEKSGILTVNRENFQKEVIESDLPVVVDAYGSWCSPCKRMLPIFTEVSQEWAGKVKFVKLNISEEEELAEKLNIQAVPTFVFFKEGQEVGTLKGDMSKEFFGQQFQELFGLELA